MGLAALERRNHGRKWSGAGAAGRKSHAGRLALFLFPSAILLSILLVSGCATPKVGVADPQILLSSGLLSFLQDDVTTREEVVLKLGLPSAQIEGDTILMYQLMVEKDGTWHLVAPQWNPTAGLRSWSEGTGSLVLVFGENGILRKHSLVTSQ